MYSENGSEGSSSIQSPNDIRRRQKTLLFAGLGGVVVVVMCMLLLTNNDGEVAANTPTEKEIKRTSINLPSSNLSTDEIWIEKSESALKNQDTKIDMLQNKIRELEKKLEMSESEGDKKLENLKQQLGSDDKKNKGTTSFNGLPIAPFGGRTATKLAKSSSSSNTDGALLGKLPPPPKGGNTLLAMADDNKSSSAKGPIGANSGKGGTSSLPPINTAERGIVEVSLEESPDSKALGEAQAKKETKNAANYLPAGSFTQAVLLSGLDAPTGSQAQSNPQPVLLKLSENSILPNRWRSRTKECLVTGAGYGDLSSERAFVRMEMLSCVLIDGSIVETVIDGFISGEDGKAGMRGNVVSKQGQAIGYAALAGLFSGFGSAAEDSLGTQSISPLGSTRTLDTDEVWKSGAYTGFATSMDRISKFYVDMADRLFPIVEVPAGRTVTMVLTKGTAFGDDVDINETGSNGGSQYPRPRDDLASISERYKQ